MNTKMNSKHKQEFADQKKSKIFQHSQTFAYKRITHFIYIVKLAKCTLRIFIYK